MSPRSASLFPSVNAAQRRSRASHDPHRGAGCLWAPTMRGRSGSLPSIEDRMFARVDTSGGLDSCWPWMGQIDRQGYGRFNPHRQGVLAHRAMYEHANGPIPPGLTIDHLCRNPRCVNPLHLRAVTQGENVLAPGSRAPSAINRLKTHCPKGHPYSGANLKLSRQGHRHCRVCENERSRNVWRARHDAS